MLLRSVHAKIMSQVGNWKPKEAQAIKWLAIGNPTVIPVGLGLPQHCTPEYVEPSSTVTTTAAAAGKTTHQHFAAALLGTHFL